MTPAQAQKIADAERLLASRIARKAPEDMIARARRDLAEALAAAQAGPSQAASAATPAVPARLLGLLVIAVAGFAAGIQLGKTHRSGTLGYLGRSAARGLIYQAVGALGK
jgi:hypothetical protein